MYSNITKVLVLTLFDLSQAAIKNLLLISFTIE